MTQGLEIGPIVGADADDEYTQRRTQDGVAILSFAGPQGNRMDAALIEDLSRGVQRAISDDGVRAIVLTARGPDFCAGPLSNLPAPSPKPPQVPVECPALAQLCAKIEDSPKPVIAALHGRVASGGLAVALSCEARVADRRTVLHAPEFHLHQIPPGGLSTRLAWWLGAQTALDLLGTGAPCPATHLPALFASLETEALLPAAVELAQARALQPRLSDQQRRPGLTDTRAYLTALTAAREQGAASNDLIELIEAALLLPYDQALAFDQTRAETASVSPQARALAHLDRASQRALDTPETRSCDPLSSHQGPLLAALSPERAAQILPALVLSGRKILLVDALNGEACETALLRALETSPPRTDIAHARSLIQRVPTLPTPCEPALALCDADTAPVLEPQLAPDIPLCIWCPQAESLPVMEHPARALAVVPAPTRPVKLCELIVQPNTDPETVAHATQLLQRAQIIPIRSALYPALPCLIRTMAQTAQCLRELGVNETDLSEIEILPPGFARGQSTPETTTLPFSPERAILLATINEAAHLLENGTSLRPSDLDLCMVLGAGWPETRGGPLAEAGTLGPLIVRQELDQLAPFNPDLWTPAPIFDELIRRGWRFEDLNTG